MKYKFHVGDYVELKDGRYGYITEILCSTFQFHLVGLNPKLIIMQYPLYDSYCLYSNNFNRIGQYDFTKKDEGKIEPLCEEYTKSFPICKTITAGNDSEWYSIDIGVMSKKINELADAVNRLEEKVNEMAQS